MRIQKIISKILICILCVFCMCNFSFAADNVPYGDVGDYGNWITDDNMAKFNNGLADEMSAFQSNFETNLHSVNFIPIEIKLGVVFMKAISSIDSVLQMSLVRFTVLFLIFMYAFWIGINAYKTIRESTDYKTVFYDLFKKGLVITTWIIILEIGPAQIFTMIITPIIALGTYISNFILDSIAQTYSIQIPNICPAIHDYVNANNSAGLLIKPDAAADIMCLPGRLSTYFYHATASAWQWMISGFGHSATAIIVGGACVVIFIKCIFKYAFMTLGVVADLFFTLLMLPFTAIAESAPTTDEKNYVAQIFNGFLKLFNTKKITEIINIYINAAIYFVSLSLMISICAVLLTNIISVSSNNTFNVAAGMTTIICGALILYLADKTDEFAKQLGGDIDDSFGTQIKDTTKKLWGDMKKLGSMAYKDWLKAE